jgi:hypothetical protein
MQRMENGPRQFLIDLVNTYGPTGFEAPAAAWEVAILPARMTDYDPALLDDACLSHCPSGSGMSFDKVDTFNYDTFVFRVSKAHLALLTLVLASDNQDCIVLSDFHSNFPYKTSGASEIILVKFFSRNSRPTAPNIRVPLRAIWM